nr:hypothetical protein [Hydrogenovibrio crunogenus]
MNMLCNTSINRKAATIDRDDQAVVADHRKLYMALSMKTKIH